MSRAVLHCDLDAFYASVEQLDHPEWRGKPVIVGGGPRDRGVVSAASYEARAFGVRSAMPLRVAARLCPQGMFVGGHHARYAALSDRVMALFEAHTPLVEPISLDEAFLDVTATAHLFEQVRGAGEGLRPAAPQLLSGPEALGRALKARVRTETGLVLSVGAATNKLCAKVASDLGKPDGFVVVPAGGEADFLAPLPLERLWGVGPKTREALAALGLRTIGDLARADRQRLEARFGAAGVALCERARGIDEDPVEAHERAKSVGGEHTFDVDETDDERALATLLRLAEGVAARLREDGLRGRCVTLKIRLAPFETHTRRHTAAEATDDGKTIYAAARELFHRARAADRRPVRLIGVAISALEDARLGRQLGLFEQPRLGRLNAALDAVRQRYGERALERASARRGEARRRASDHPRRRPAADCG